MFPPLFPFLIAATSALTRNVEIAGRLVSVWMGTLLVLPIYFIGRHLYNRKAAYLAAALIACHPLLVNFSATVYCETTYLTLLLTAVYWSFRALRLRTARTFILAGVSFGLTYLTRPEAVIYLVFALALTLVYVSRTCRQDLSKAALRAIWLPLAFLVFAAPYILWLHAETGQWRLEGKSPLNYTTAWETLQGRDPYDAQYGVDSDLTERGVWIQANLSTIRRPVSNRGTSRVIVSPNRRPSWTTQRTTWLTAPSSARRCCSLSLCSDYFAGPGTAKLLPTTCSF